MQRLGNLSDSELASALHRDGLRVAVGPYNYSVESKLPRIAEGLRTLYPDYMLSTPAFVDYPVSINHCGLSSRLQRKVEFLFDFQRAFGLIPLKQAYAFLEWGMNWCVSMHANEYLKLHAAVIAKDNKAIIMPGVPGAGKSTLCAALALQGWRVLSDEHALIPMGSTDVVPLCRPISLKNKSIEVIQAFDHRAVFGPQSEDTHKGTVAHMKADLHPESHDRTPLPTSTMVFPRYSTSEKQMLSPREKSRSFILAAYHSFNYSLLGRAGFNAMVTLIDAVDCYDLVYHDLEWAIRTFDELHKGVPN